MPARSHRSTRRKNCRRVEKTIREWESQYPDTWILLEVTREDNAEPVRAKLVAAARDLGDLQEVWS